VKIPVASHPIALGLEEGISVYNTIQYISVYNAMNYGFSDTPAVYLCILSRLQSKLSQFFELPCEDLRYQGSIKTKTDRIA
jgi:hypothetical protein